MWVMRHWPDSEQWETARMTGRWAAVQRFPVCWPPPFAFSWCFLPLNPSFEGQKKENWWIFNRSVQYSNLLANFEHHGRDSRLLHEVQNVRAHQERWKNCHGQRTHADGRILFPTWMHGKDFQDHRVMNITAAYRIHLIEMSGGLTYLGLVV